MTSMPIASIARLNCFNRPIVLVSQGACAQPLLTFVPYTESRWRLIFAQFFVLDIQICGPNLILVRDGAFSVQLNSGLPETNSIPRLKVISSFGRFPHRLKKILIFSSRNFSLNMPMIEV